MKRLTLRGCPASIRNDAWWLDSGPHVPQGGYRNPPGPRSVQVMKAEKKA